MKEISLEDGDVRIVGALDFDRGDQGLTPRRLPAWTRPQVPAFMELMVLQSAGVRFEFTTTSRAIEIDEAIVFLSRRAVKQFPGVFLQVHVVDQHPFFAAA